MKKQILFVFKTTFDMNRDMSMLRGAWSRLDRRESELRQWEFDLIQREVAMRKIEDTRGRMIKNHVRVNRNNNNKRRRQETDYSKYAVNKESHEETVQEETPIVNCTLNLDA